MKFVFKSGLRKVTVEADNLQDAEGKAIDVLERRITRAGGEPPVAYDLVPVSIDGKPQGKVYQFTLACGDRSREITYTTPVMQGDVGMVEMLHIIAEDLEDPTYRVTMIREMKL